MDWSARDVELLRALWADGYTKGEIAKQTGWTRNRVAGKLFRLGLTDQNRDGDHAEAIAEARREDHRDRIKAAYDRATAR